MNLLYLVYNEVLYRPFLNGLIFIYNFLPIHDLGVAIIILTVLLRLALYPLSRKAINSQRAMSEIQPQINEIQKKYKGSKEEQAKMLMALYAEKKINPFSGCLPILIQLPVLIALFQVFRTGLGDDFSSLYHFVENPGVLNTIAFGYINLTKPSLFFGILAGASQFFQARLIPSSPIGSSGSGEFLKVMQWQTKYFLPVLFAFWSLTLPSALPLYWTILNIFGIIEYGQIGRFFKKKPNLHDRTN